MSVSIDVFAQLDIRVGKIVEVDDIPQARKPLYRFKIDFGPIGTKTCAGGIKAYDIYGLSEIVGPGVAMECVCQAGPHIFEDYFYPEIIDSKTGVPCPEGEEGELVLTTLDRLGSPLLRYRTGDLVRPRAGTPCPCGRPGPRLVQRTVNAAA